MTEQALRDLQAAWERGAQRAVEDTRRNDELAAQELDAAAGLHVQSGLKGGYWFEHSRSCFCDTILCVA